MVKSKCKVKKVLFVGFLIFLVSLLLVCAVLFYVAMYLPLSDLPIQESNIIKKISEDNPDDKTFLKQTYDYVTSKFNGKKGCWEKHPSRAFSLDSETILSYANDCLPCNTYHKIFEAYLLTSERFNSSQISPVITTCPSAVMLHVYSEIILEDEIINVDSWGRDFNVTFGQTIKDTSVCMKKP